MSDLNATDVAAATATAPSSTSAISRMIDAGTSVAIATAAAYVTARSYLAGYLGYFGVPTPWIDVPLTQLFDFAIDGSIPALLFASLYYWYLRATLARSRSWIVPVILVDLAMCYRALVLGGSNFWIVSVIIIVLLPLVAVLYQRKPSGKKPETPLAVEWSKGTKGIGQALLAVAGIVLLSNLVSFYAYMDARDDGIRGISSAWRAEGKQLIFISGDITIWIQRVDGNCTVQIQKEEKLLGKRWCPPGIERTMGASGLRLAP